MIRMQPNRQPPFDNAECQIMTLNQKNRTCETKPFASTPLQPRRNGANREIRLIDHKNDENARPPSPRPAPRRWIVPRVDAPT
jgi:hypothetical protein